MAQKTATIIGASGFIGNALMPHLSRSGWTCWAPSRDHQWPDYERSLGAIFYCAGLTADYAQRPADTVEAHVSLLTRVLQSSSYESLVYLSSTRLYDALGVAVQASEDLSIPVMSHSPRHLYDLTKLTGEAICLALGQGKARVARLACVYGGADDVDGFLPLLLRQVADARPGDVINVASSPSIARDYVHLTDVVAALENIAQGGEHLLYNVASGQNVSNAALAAWIHAQSGRHVRFDHDRAFNPPASINIQRMTDEYGWRPARVQDVLGPWLEKI